MESIEYFFIIYLFYFVFGLSSGMYLQMLYTNWLHDKDSKNWGYRQECKLGHFQILGEEVIMCYYH